MSQPPTPSWTQPWEPPAVPPPPVGGAALPDAGRPGSRLVLVSVAAVAALAGAVAACFLVTAVFLGGAKDIGQEIGAALAPAVEDSVSKGVAEGMAEGMPYGGVLDEELAPTEAVQQFPAVEPGVLGPDPVLDAYAGSCYGGDLQACDDLYYEAPPLSDYEQYAATCGGRVKPFMTSSCLELD